MLFCVRSAAALSELVAARELPLGSPSHRRSVRHRLTDPYRFVSEFDVGSPPISDSLEIGMTGASWHPVPRVPPETKRKQRKTAPSGLMAARQATPGGWTALLCSRGSSVAHQFDASFFLAVCSFVCVHGGYAKPPEDSVKIW